MSTTTNIAWTRSTFNPWIGCTKIGPGCDGCYAEALDRRVKFGGHTNWGTGVPRYLTQKNNWDKVKYWDRLARRERETGEAIGYWPRPGFWPVFCASLADVFDNEVPSRWRHDLYTLIERTPNLQWQIVTKRIGNVHSMIPHAWHDRFPENVRLIITIVDQNEATRDIPKLADFVCKNGISYEPALGPVDWKPFLNVIDWIIIGGESTQGAHKARAFHLEWARETIAACIVANIPVFMKQIGSNAHFACPHGVTQKELIANTKARAGDDPNEWPQWLRIREIPE